MPRSQELYLRGTAITDAGITKHKVQRLRLLELDEKPSRLEPGTGYDQCLNSLLIDGRYCRCAAKLEALKTCVPFRLNVALTDSVFDHLQKLEKLDSIRIRGATARRIALRIVD